MSESMVRVLFLFERPESWINVHLLWRHMSTDRRFAPTVWVVAPVGLVESQARREHARAIEACRNVHGIEAVAWPGRAPKPGEFDVAIFTSPYDRARPPALHFQHVAAVVRVTVYVPYGLVTGGGEKNGRLQYARPAPRQATLVLARSEFEVDAYRRECPTGARHVAVLGLPRLDAVANLDRFEMDPTLKQQICGRRAVLWNSHYSFLPKFAVRENYSSFDIFGAHVLGLAANRREIAVIWRPHPHLLGELEASGMLGEADLGTFRQELRDLGVILDERIDHRHAFAASDALMSDAGSFLIEYLATGKPILFLRNPDGEPLNEETSMLVQSYDIASTTGDIDAFVDRVIANLDPKREARLDARSRHLPLLDGRASERVAQRIFELLAPPTSFALDGKRFPVTVRLIERLQRVAIKKRSASMLARRLARRRAVAKERVMEFLSEYPKTLRALNAGLDAVGFKKASRG